MDMVQELWLPILLSAVAVFLVSSLIHMVIPIHKGDYKKLPNEEKVLESIRAQGVTPGHYMFPMANSMKDMCTPEMTEKFNRGPVGHMTVLPNGHHAIGKSLVQWFLFCILIGLVTAYICSMGLSKGADFKLVFRFASTVSFLGYGLSCITDSIWKGMNWGVTAKFVFDGLLYGLATGATFAWLWPQAL